MEILALEDVSFAYPEAEVPAVSHVGLTVRQGEFVVLCGRSGCGKSTLLSLLKREIAPYGKREGVIRYRGKPIEEWDDRTAASQIGIVRQDPESQIVTDTVWHELAFGAESLGFDTAHIRRRVAETASYFGMEGDFHRKTATLSGGQKQQLALAAVMTTDPQLLLLDEPTAQLDPIAASRFIATLHKLNRELGVTVLLIEHRLEEVFPSADRVLLLDEGQLVLDAPPRRVAQLLRERPHEPLREALPAAMRVFDRLGETGDSPLTVREGRAFISARYDNRITALPPSPPPPQTSALLTLTDVFFRYERDSDDVLRGLSLTVYDREHLCLVGGNGTGKTTALRVLAGLRAPHRGKVMLEGRPLRKAVQAKRIALLPQQPLTLFTADTVQQQLENTCRIRGLDREQTAQETQAVAKRLGIEMLTARHPHDLSGGEQQLAALALLLLSRPRVLLLDEPTKGLDAAAKCRLRELLAMLTADGLTVVTVTHDIAFAAAAANRVGLFFDGALADLDTPTAFFANNRFYTTAAARLCAGYYEGAVLCEQVAELCRLNGKKAVTPP